MGKCLYHICYIRYFIAILTRLLTRLAHGLYRTVENGQSAVTDVFMFSNPGRIAKNVFEKHKAREHMSSAQIDVAKRKLDTHDNHRKNTTREHISKRHMNTQQRENTSKRHENTPKGKHN